MDALRSGIRRLVAGARRGRHASGSVQIADPRNAAVVINAGGRGSDSTVSSRQTVISENGTTRIETTRSSHTAHQPTQRAERKEETHGRPEDDQR